MTTIEIESGRRKVWMEVGAEHFGVSKVNG